MRGGGVDVALALKIIYFMPSLTFSEVDNKKKTYHGYETKGSDM